MGTQSSREGSCSQLLQIKHAKILNPENSQLPNDDNICNSCFSSFRDFFTKEVQVPIKWQQNFILNCNEMKQQHPWVQNLHRLVKKVKYRRQIYLSQFQKIRLQTREIKAPGHSILSTPSQIEQFKKNLKKSVLITFGNIPKTNRQLFTEDKLHSSMINPSTISFGLPNNEKDAKSSMIGAFRQLPNGIENSPNKNLRESIINFYDDTLSCVFKNQKEITKQSAQALDMFVKFTILLQRHMNCSVHPFFKIRAKFTKILSNEFKQYFLPFNNISEEVIFKLVKMVKTFLLLLRQAVMDFYHLQTIKEQNCLLCNADNLYILVSNIVFKDCALNDIVVTLCSKYNKNSQQSFKEIYYRFRGRNPQYFGVSVQYALNNSTLKKHLEKMSAQSNLQNMSVSDFSQNQEPYFLCINAFRKMTQAKSPVQKMKVIMEVADNMTKSINDFYKINKLPLTSTVLDADQVLAIFCYILASSDLSNIHTHLFILQNFASQHQLISVTGYYYSVLCCALEQLQRNISSIADMQMSKKPSF